MKLTYEKFLESKRQMYPDAGFKPVWIPDFLFDFQKSLVEWAIRGGRTALFVVWHFTQIPMKRCFLRSLVLVLKL